MTASYSPKRFFLETLSNYWTFPLVTTGILWQVLYSMHKFIIELHVLQYLFVNEPNKQQRSVGIISNFTKRETFFISYNNQLLFGVMSQYSPLLAPSKNVLPLHFSLVKKEIYWDTHMKDKITDLFWKLPGVPYCHRQSRKRMMNTFIMVNITPI